MPLTGTATYNGDAAGVYYANGLSSSPDIGSFTADVELMADFKSNSEYGTVEGEVNNFVFDGDTNSSFASLYPAMLNLSTNTYSGFGVAQQGTQNIFDRSWPTNYAPERGGWIHGITGGTAETGESFGGPWWGMFFGNGDPSSDLPTSIGGTFGASIYPGNNQQSERGLAGSFGAHRDEHEQTSADPVLWFNGDSNADFSYWGWWAGIVAEDEVICTALFCKPQGEETFFEVYLNHHDDGTFSTTLNGTPSGTSPVGGSAVWTGGVFAAGTEEYVEGDSRLEVDFAAAAVDVDFTNFDNNRADMSWSRLAIDNGMFGDSAGSINGSFYGDAHEGVAGTFGRDGLTGVFGALRSSGS